MYKALTIAGSDTSGGAGIQADLKTFQEFDVYGMTALTVIVAQETETWAHNVYPIDIDLVAAQIDTVFKGIKPDAVKTGMLPTSGIIGLTAKKLKEYNAKNIVIDPVMVCKGTEAALNPDSAESIKKELIPLADITTPNIYEAAQLTGIRSFESIEDIKKAAQIIHSLGAKNVFIKGGTKFNSGNATDVFYDGAVFEILEAPISAANYTHGAGCTTAAAITAGLARGLSVYDAVVNAKDFVTKAIANGFKLNGHVDAVRHSASRIKGGEVQD